MQCTPMGSTWKNGLGMESQPARQAEKERRLPSWPEGRAGMVIKMSASRCSTSHQLAT